MNEYKQVMELVALGMLLALLGAVSASVGTVALAWAAKTRKAFNEVDKALAPFGRTATGQYLHGQLLGLTQYVDQPSDKTVQDLLKVPILRDLHKQGFIDDKALSRGLSQALGLTIDLLDGKPDGLTGG